MQQHILKHLLAAINQDLVGFIVHDTVSGSTDSFENSVEIIGKL